MGVDDVINVYKQVGEESRDKPSDSNKNSSNQQKEHGHRRGRHRPRRRGPGFPAVCVTCGRETQVPFEPTSERQAYCQECYRQVKSASRAKPETAAEAITVGSAPVVASQQEAIPEPEVAMVSPAPALTAERPEDLGDNRMHQDKGWAVEDTPESKGKRSVVGEFTATPLLRRYDGDDAKNGAPSEHSLRGTNPRRYTSK